MPLQMDNIAAELTCAQGCRAGRVYVGAADGSVLAIAANGAGELPLAHARWGLRVCARAVTSVCGVEAGEDALLLVGSASGELVVLREELEVRRFQLESAVQQICYDRNGEFIVGDALGNLYAVTQYEILWKRRLPAIAPRYDDVDAECFYPAVGQPSVRAIARAKLLDIEKTLSNYILVATGQKHLLMTHRGKEFGVIASRTPIATLAIFSVSDEDVVLAAGEEGIIYRLVRYRDKAPKDMPAVRFTLEVWTQVSFPIAKLLPVKQSTDAKASEFAWVCLGTDGEVALFRGQELVKQWGVGSFASTQDVELGFPVDLTMIKGADTDAQAAIVFSDRIHVLSIELTGL